jgi:drug/metabolite transporter (DMT)-like permease
MNMKTIISLLLIALGIVVLCYSGLHFNTPGQPIQFFGLQIATSNSHFIPPAIGAVALVVGLLLLVIKPKSI